VTKVGSNVILRRALEQKTQDNKKKIKDYLRT